MHPSPLKLRVRPARRTCEQLLREELVVCAARTGPAKLRFEPLETRLPGAVALAEPCNPIELSEDGPRLPRSREGHSPRPRTADHPADPLISRSSAAGSWAFADQRAASAPPPPAVRFTTAPAGAGAGLLAIVGFDGAGQMTNGRPANPSYLRYVLTGEVGGWTAGISAA